MIKITKDMIESMYSNSDNQDALIDQDKSANSIRMKTEFDDGDTLQVNVYSHYVDHSIKRELIHDGETDAETIFEKSSFVDDKYSIDSDDVYVIEDSATQYLEELHEEFSKETKEYDIDHIEYEIKEYQESLSNVQEKENTKPVRKMKL